MTSTNHTHFRDLQVVDDDPQREVYVRAGRVLDSGTSVEVGVELRYGDDYRQMMALLTGLLRDVDSATETQDTMGTTIAIEERIKTTWLNRAYFIESWVEGETGWVQVFVPFGLSKNK